MVHDTTLIVLTCIGLGVIMCYPFEANINHNFRKSSNSDSVQFCGKQLADTLSLVCNGNYNTMENILSPRNSPTEKPRFPFQSREDARSFIRYKQRRRRGITDECCTKSCTIDELRSFCAGGSP